jgi:hypothetical protein
MPGTTQLQQAPTLNGLLQYQVAQYAEKRQRLLTKEAFAATIAALSIP